MLFSCFISLLVIFNGGTTSENALFFYFMRQTALLTLLQIKKHKHKFVCLKCCYFFHVRGIKYQFNITAL